MRPNNKKLEWTEMYLLDKYKTVNKKSWNVTVYGIVNMYTVNRKPF